MYERHKRRYSLCSKGERAMDVVLIKIHRDKEAAYPLALSASTTASRHRTECTDLPRASVCPSVSSPGSATHRDSGSDTESFFSTDTGEDCVFRKGDEPLTGSDSTSEVSVSCSSTDDTASVGPASSSPESCVEGQGRSWSPEGTSKVGSVSVGGEAAAPVGTGGAGETEEEAKDRLTEVPLRSALRKPSIRSLSPFRRHSWGPGRNSEGDSEMNQRRLFLTHA
ncbi:A-kinase anchor protein 13-like [Aplochiton taeniatus]